MITWKPGKYGKTEAAYCGLIRVGYVTESTKGDWMWNLNVLAPSGGTPHGRGVDVDAARAALTAAFSEWLEHAGLELRTAQLPELRK